MRFRARLVLHEKGAMKSGWFVLCWVKWEDVYLHHTYYELPEIIYRHTLFRRRFAQRVERVLFP